MKRFTAAQAGTTLFCVLLLSVAGSAVASAEDVVDDGSVDINVEVTDITTPGVLALTVASDETVLTEQTSADPLVRQFAGTLPTVTVTDTRSGAPDVPWYVLGTASDFVAGTDLITADHLGWSPTLAGDYGPQVQPGGDVETVVDDAGSEGLGYADGELLYANYDQEATHEQGAWSANAALLLKVNAATVKPGSYTSVLTLSLFE